MTLSGMSQEDERKQTTAEVFEIGLDDVEAGGSGNLWDNLDTLPNQCSLGIRRSGVSLISGVLWNMRIQS